MALKCSRVGALQLCFRGRARDLCKGAVGCSKHRERIKNVDLHCFGDDWVRVRVRKIGLVERLVPGRDGVVRAVHLRVGKSNLERPVQHLYPLELSCDRTVVKPAITLNADVREFIPKRAAATAARDRIVAITDTEQET